MINLFVIVTFLLILIGDLVNLFKGEADINYFTSNILLESICVLNLVLNSKGKIGISRILLLLAIFLLLFIMTPLLNPIRNEAYFWYPYAPTGTSLVVYFLFLKEDEQKYLIIVVLLNLGLVLFSDIILNQITHEYLEIKAIMQEDYLSYKLNPVLMFIFVNLTMFYSFQRSRKYESFLLEAKEKVIQKNRALITSSADKDKFNSIIAHDLRGPFGSFLKMTQLMKNEPQTLAPENRDNFVSLLNESAIQVNKLLENLLEWSNVQTGSMIFQPEKTKIKSLIKDSIALLTNIADDKNIVITEHYILDVELLLDRHMVRTIMRNLISNAIKFTPDNGHIDIHVEKLDEDLTITISDSGKGMSDSQIEKLFRIDEITSTRGTNNEKGSGLGLLIVKDFVDKHGGAIHVESEVSNGSSISIRLPMVQEMT